MSYKSIRLPGTQPSGPAVRECSAPACSGLKPADGGIQLSPVRWMCADCWRRRQFKGLAK